MTTIRTAEDLAALRKLLQRAAEQTRTRLAAIVADPRIWTLLKFERLGCDPLNPQDPQNIAEQIDQQATHEAAADGLAILMARHPGRIWTFAPGARGSGHDLTTSDGEVAAEVFAAVSPDNNDKLRRDVEKVSKFSGANRYVIYRSPNSKESQATADGVTTISLGMRTADAHH